ncbi:hypothetical protein [uncultured Eubacterium sp.]|uniref:hypothetical protein n=1 Tax=uncultured Eubacterium sp. TaxID=165185 RepID=UPI002632D09A|nr:hypothetical protein [uncultured Eubacterium sp.]
MAIYTNSFQDIMHKYDHDGSNLTYEQKLVKLCEYIFDFNYDYKNDLTFKAFFEPYFIEHFFNEEFAFETLDYFKVKLKNRMQEVLPFYIPLYQTFYINTIDLTLIEKEESNEKGGNDESGKTNSNSTSTNNSLDISSDLPVNAISVNNINDVKYATDGKRGSNTSTNESNTINTHNNIYTRDSTRKRTNNGLDNATRYSSEFLNLCSEMINKFNDLFLIIF